MVKKTKNVIISSILITMVVVILISMSGCSGFAQAAEQLNFDNQKSENIEADQIRTAAWTSETHSTEVEPNYEVVFPQDSVNRIDIIITEENWEMMISDMTEMMGEFGSGGGMGMRLGGHFQGDVPPDFPEGNLPRKSFGNEVPEGEIPQMPGGGEPPEDVLPNESPEGRGIPDDGRRSPGGDFRERPGDGGFNMDLTDENPVWVTATIKFDGDVWEHVGIRFKGNSSLKSAWSSGNLKIPFKLDFDQFEDDYPETEDQRFYGFKQLSLSNNFSDDSYLREKVTADIFREFGVASAHTAFYEVYVDYGEGSEYFGLYTMVEMVEDTVIEEQFSDSSGNLYKPDGTGATFAEGSFNEESFDKETNQEESDYDDIHALFQALHVENRLTDPEAWRKGLESVFDIDTFLRWLAVNTVVQNWDTYGVMSHNYFLYTDPATNLVTWIPWDNNMSLSGSGTRGETLSLSLDEVSERWPLIRFLMDDPVYQAQYEGYLEEVVETIFYPEKMTNLYTAYHDLISSSVLKETEEATTMRSKSAFENSLQELIDQVYERTQAVKDYLAD